MRAAFECTVVDLPRTMLVQHPHLMSEVQVAVIVTELTLAAARDTIRLLSWMKTNAPQCQIQIVVNRVHAAGQPEINRKDFEGSIERRIDHLIPFDHKLAIQSAKLGKPLAEAGKNSRTVTPLGALVTAITGAVTEVAEARKGGGGKPGSLMNKLGGLRGLLAKPPSARK
jgi:pilus assembly protein CpaE